MSLIPPQDIEAEQAVLGALLLLGGGEEPDVADVYSELQPEAFYRAGHGAMFAACRELFVEQVEIDERTVVDRLRTNGTLAIVGGATEVVRITESTPTAANLRHYSRIVRDMWLRRRLIIASAAATQKAYDLEAPVHELLDEAAESISQVSISHASDEPLPLSTLVRCEFTQLRKDAEAEQEKFGVPTGFYELDEKLCGLQAGDFVILAGRPSMGKTALALAIAGHAAIKSDVPTLVFELEMKNRGLVQRMLASEARVDGQALRRPKRISADEWTRLASAAGKLDSRKLFVTDRADVTVLDIRSRARACKAKHGLGLIVVDYVQLIRPVQRLQNREREVAEISIGLKGLGKELNVPVVALAQLSRGVEAREQKRPRLSDLRESGALEQDSDVVLFVHREGYYDAKKPSDVAEIIIGKQRNGPTGIIEIGWDSRCVKFYNRRVA